MQQPRIFDKKDEAALNGAKHTGFLTFNESNKKFYHFDSPDHFFDYSDSLPLADRTFHESIFEGAQVPKFDIDWQNLPVDRYESVHNDFLEYLSAAFNELYGFELDLPTQVIVCDSSRPDKFSRHYIICAYSFADCTKAQYFTSYLSTMIPDEWRANKALDMQVNKSFQNFRIVGQHKKGMNNTKKVIHPVEPADADERRQLYKSTLIRHILWYELPRICPPDAKPIAEVIVDNAEIACLLDLLKDHYVGYRVRNINNNWINFTKIAAAVDCRICNEAHHKDNAMFWSLTGKKVLMMCHQKLGTSVEIHSGDVQLAVAVAPKRKRTPQEILQHALSSAVGLTTPTDIPVTHYNSRDCEDLPMDFNTHILKAEMGTGKTKTCIRYLQEHTPRRVVIVSFRTTYADQAVKRYNDAGIPFVDYRTFKGKSYPNTATHLVVQYESLHKFNCCPETTPDLLILDELEQIFFQMDNNKPQRMTGTLMTNWRAFEWLLKYSRKCLVMDATADFRSYDLLKRARTNLTMQVNDYQPLAGRPMKYWLNDTAMMSQIINDLAAGLREFCGILEEMLDKLIKKIFGDAKKVGLYTSDTSAEDRKDIENVNEFWVNKDIVIYTPTISAAVSFEIENHFSKFYGYFVDSSCGPKTCYQMMGRVRSVAEYNVCFCETQWRVPETFADIEKFVTRKANMLHMYKDSEETIKAKRMDLIAKMTDDDIQYQVVQGVLDEETVKEAKRKDWSAEKKRLEDLAHVAALDYELAPNGEYQFVNKNLHYYTVINNLVEHARSKNKFKLLFFGIVKAAGINVVLAEQPAGDLKEFGAQKKQAKEEVTREAAEKIANAPGIHPNEAEALSKRRNELSDADSAKLTRYELYECYKLREEYHMTAEFVLDYHKPKAKRQFYILNEAIRVGSYYNLKNNLLNG